MKILILALALLVGLGCTFLRAQPVIAVEVVKPLILEISKGDNENELFLSLSGRKNGMSYALFFRQKAFSPRPFQSIFSIKPSSRVDNWCANVVIPTNSPQGNFYVEEVAPETQTPTNGAKKASSDPAASWFVITEITEKE